MRPGNCANAGNHPCKIGGATTTGSESAATATRYSMTIRSVESGRCGPCSFAPAPNGRITTGAARSRRSASGHVRSPRKAPFACAAAGSLGAAAAQSTTPRTNRRAKDITCVSGKSRAGSRLRDYRFPDSRQNCLSANGLVSEKSSTRSLPHPLPSSHACNRDACRRCQIPNARS